MDEVTKEQIFIIAAIANILALLLLIIPYFIKLTPYFELIPTNYRIYLFFFLTLVLVFIEAVPQLLLTPKNLLLFGFKPLFAFLFLPILDCWTASIILKILSLRSKKYPICIKNDNILYTIENPEGKLVHCEKNQLMRANQGFITTYNEEIIVDGEIENIRGSIEGAESTIIAAPKREGMAWNVQHVFHRPLPKNKYVKRIFSFDFIDSFTENKEYVLCRIVNIVEDFQLSIIFPKNRSPQEIRGFLRRGPIEIEKQDPPIYTYELADKRKRIDWQVKYPKIGDIYKIIWSW